MSDVITAFQSTDGNTMANMNAKFAQANAEFVNEIAHRQNTSNPHNTTAAQVGAISSGYVSIMANEDILAKCNAQSVSCNLYIAQGAINTPDSTWSSGVLNTTGVNSDCAITIITQYGKIYANKYTSGNWSGWTSKADYASGDIAWATPALRNEIIIPNTSSIPSGLADGTIVVRYTP